MRRNEEKKAFLSYFFVFLLLPFQTNGRVKRKEREKDFLSLFFFGKWRNVKFSEREGGGRGRGGRAKKRGREGRGETERRKREYLSWFQPKKRERERKVFLLVTLAICYPTPFFSKKKNFLIFPNPQSYSFFFWLACEEKGEKKSDTTVKIWQGISMEGEDASVSLHPNWHPTNNALLINFWWSSGAKILLMSTNLACKSALQTCKDTYS